MTEASLASLYKLLKIDASDKAGASEVILARMTAMDKFKEHVTSIIKKGVFTITGDDSHLSVRDILETAAKINDKPKYDFQKKNYRRDDLLRQVDQLCPNSLMGVGYDVADIEAAINGERPLTVTNAMSRNGCYDCTRQLRFTLNGTHIHIDSDVPCEDNSNFSVEIDFPTGEVVFADWPARFSELRDAGYIDEGDDAESINYVRGQRKRSEAFAAQGIYHLSVGNSCPSWYVREDTNEILIGGREYDEEKDEERDPEGYTKKGWFCTDLWWVTMLDKSRYDEMLSKLPKTKVKPHDLKVQTATIKPGRYRFTAAPVSGEDYDDSGRIYAKAQYLGPCGDVPKVKNITESKTILTPRQTVIHTAMKYPTAFGGPYEVARFRTMDQIFNVLGSGIRSKGEFFAFITVSPGTKISDEMPVDEENATESDYPERDPYPNFKKEHSLVWEMKMKDFPTEWVEEAIWFYSKCQAYFNSDAVSGYWNGYDPAKGPSKDWIETLERRQQRAKSDEEFKKDWENDYQHPFDGDLSSFLQSKWNVERAGIDAFLKQTLKRLRTELTRRQNAG